MRHSIVYGLIASLFIAQNPQPTEAGVFATEVTQLLNHGQLVMNYIRQGQQLTEEINQTLDMIKNAAQLPVQIFGPIQQNLNDLAEIVQGGQALAYSLGNLDARFRDTFRGYGTNTLAYYRNYRNWAQTSLDTTLGSLRAAGLQGQQLQDEQTVLDSLRGMAQSSNGRMKALQVMGQIAEQQTQQLMKLRELMLADMQSKQAYQAAVIQQQAAEQAATEQFFTSAPADSDGRTFRPGVH